MQVLKHTNGNIAKVWVNNIADVESSAIDQIMNMLTLPHIFRHIAIMPDVHMGKGAVVGSVTPLDGAVAPSLVGIDIGCGMMSTKLPIKFDKGIATSKFWTEWLELIRDVIPVGMKRQNTVDNARWYGFPGERGNAVRFGKTPEEWFPSAPAILNHVRQAGSKTDTVGYDDANIQLGTLGGGKLVASVLSNNSSS